MNDDQVTGYLLAAAREYGPAELKVVESTYRRAVRVSILAERNDAAGVALEAAALLGLSGRILAPAHLVNRISKARTIGDVIDAVTDFYQPTALIKRIWRKLTDWYSKLRSLSAPNVRAIAASERRRALETQAAVQLVRAYAHSNTFWEGDPRRYYYRGYAYIAGKYKAGELNKTPNTLTMLKDYPTANGYHLGVYGTNDEGTAIVFDTNVYAMSSNLPVLMTERLVQGGRSGRPEGLIMPWDPVTQGGAQVVFSDVEPALRDTEALDKYAAVANAFEWYDLDVWPPGCDFPIPPLEPLTESRVAGAPARAGASAADRHYVHTDPIVCKPFTHTTLLK
jgi:hypothetical protein